MSSKHRRSAPRLDRRNAAKNIDYDASTSSSSADGSSHRTRSLDASFLSDQTSFRIEGIEGEFDLICRSLGLSGPEAFSIPVADWEAHKAQSPVQNPNEAHESPDSGLSEIFGSKVRVNGDEVKNGLEHSNPTEAEEIRVLVIDEIEKIEDHANIRGINVVKLVIERSELRNSVCLDDDDNDDEPSKSLEKCHVTSQSGIKGERPPLLAPPPVRLPVVADNHCSSWELIQGFAMTDDEVFALPVPVEASIEDANIVTYDEIVVGDDEDELSSNAATEVEYTVSPNGPLKFNIKNWQKGDFLGRGSYGAVYEGYTEHGVCIAVKEVSLLDEGSQGQQSIAQLEHEISLLSQFQHENIVRYLGTDTDDGKLYIFLELVTKGSLANLYHKYRLGDSQVSSYTRQILGGLNYLHERNVVHRDIKCANILVHASGSVKLADFGLAKATKLNDIKSCKGTPYWMAPEVVNGKSNGYGLAADIWSLGCTVLEMLTSKIPYSNLEGMQALFRIGRGELPSIPETLSLEARDFILNCLQVNQNNRPTAAQLLMHPFVKNQC
ncbi:hypothetical protein E3N88_06334 [Mikania micrantha]|uniref:mitogen-activated protein kinase kinase kinase n=1 Tax=Mikania micrantha TaxID=192012 RepID=A0A5N6PNI7_9ASTR|nr:hypothetical protein E3N88_06334 [Mikania micrantha]